MKYIFIIQGEGMGHTTQSLALRSMLEKNGHTVTNTFVGRSFFRPENELYRLVDHENFYSPVFLRRRDKMGINLCMTFIYNLLLTPIYIFTIFRIAFRIRSIDAQFVIVFYDMIGQLGTLFSFSGKPVFSISHHFFFGHPSFRWPSNRKAEQLMLRIHSCLASLGAKKKLALSFTMEFNIPGKKLYVIPPILRHEILNSHTIAGDHIHIYCLQPGFLTSIINLATKVPQKKFLIFLHELEKHIKIPFNVQVSLISEVKFRESMRSSELVICTAGFETLAEAVYLNKPLIIVSSKGHYEQYCNTIDALRANVATVEESFFINDLPVYTDNPAHTQFKQWINMSEEIILKHITE